MRIHGFRVEDVGYRFGHLGFWGFRCSESDLVFNAEVQS